MSSPYGLIADIHAHAWSSFATINADGVNSRLQILIDEIDRVCDEVLGAGGGVVYIAGDLFQVRGSIAPEVFNPIHACFRRNIAKGIVFYFIPGNHDLASKETTELGNAVQTFGAMTAFHVITKPRLVSRTPNVAMIPWIATKDGLRQAVEALKAEIADSRENPASYDLIIHAGIDGVLAGVPDHGLSAAEVADWGFKRVFAGDYHNHKIMEGGKVISIGALAHHNWGDIGSKAGFLLVYPDRVVYRASHAPSFIELTADDDPEQYPLLVDGNYVRIRGMRLTDAEIGKLRQELLDMGARGVTFQVARETVAVRSGAPAKATTLDESVEKYIETLTDIDVAAVKAGAADVLATVRSVSA